MMPYNMPRRLSPQDQVEDCFSVYVFHFSLLCYCVFVSGPVQYISYAHGKVWPVCAESDIKHQPANLKLHLVFIVICAEVAVQVKEVNVRRIKGSSYQLKLSWSDGSCSELSQSFQDLKATYDQVNLFLNWIVIFKKM